MASSSASISRPGIEIILTSGAGVPDVFGINAELLSYHGPIFEIFLTAPMAATDFYGGARETRRIDRGTYL
jgi:hypothetical protein